MFVFFLGFFVNFFFREIKIYGVVFIVGFLLYCILIEDIEDYLFVYFFLVICVSIKLKVEWICNNIVIFFRNV